MIDVIDFFERAQKNRKLLDDYDIKVHFLLVYNIKWTSSDLDVNPEDSSV